MNACVAHAPSPTAYRGATAPMPPYVQEHLTLVKRIARHLAVRLPDSIDLNDLIQAGMIGLLEAAKHYDASHGAGASFATFAGLRIRGAMLDEIRRNHWAPRTVTQQTRQLSQAIRAIEQETGAEATPSAIAERLGVDLDTYHYMAAESARSQVLALESVSNEEGEPFGTTEHIESPMTHLQQAEFQNELTAAIQDLPERERNVMGLYYQEELTLKEIGHVLGVSESRVCQLHGQALVRLRARLRDWGSADVLN